MTLSSLLAWLLGGLAGSMLFFAFVVAPTVFRALPGEQAGPFLRALFPRYYLWGLVAALLATLLAQFAGAGVPVVAACATVTVLFVFARQTLMPAINRARLRQLDGDAAAAARFRRLHGFSVLVNGLQLLLLAAATVWLVRV